MGAGWLRQRHLARHADGVAGLDGKVDEEDAGGRRASAVTFLSCFYVFLSLIFVFLLLLYLTCIYVLV